MNFKPAQVLTVILEVVLGKLCWKVALTKRVRFERRLYFFYHFLVSSNGKEETD